MKDQYKARGNDQSGYGVYDIGSMSWVSEQNMSRETAEEAAALRNEQAGARDTPRRPPPAVKPALLSVGDLWLKCELDDWRRWPPGAPPGEWEWEGHINIWVPARYLHDGRRR